IFRTRLIISKRRSNSSNNNTTRIIYLTFWRNILIIMRKSFSMTNLFKIKLFKLQPVVTKLFNFQKMIKKMR
ncbi:hypothetical protein S83_042567, partial [Arachis hypogaea]